MAPRSRRTLSCFPCRKHKQKCDKGLPCQTCRRYGREDQCHEHPPPGTLLAVEPSRPSALSLRKKIRSSQTCKDFDASPLDNSRLVASGCEASDSRSTPLIEAIDARHPAVPRLALNHPGVSPEHDEDSMLDLSIDLLDRPETYWKVVLARLLPDRVACDILISHYFENMNWLFQTIHEPSFREAYEALWTQSCEDIDLGFLALLYIIMAVCSMHLPNSMIRSAGLRPGDVAKTTRRWYLASQQALHAGGFDSKPSLIAIQTYLVSAGYWRAMKDFETLNSQFGKAVRYAQSLGLDSESPPTITSHIEREMRHRVWWDLVTSDTFQSILTGRRVLIRVSECTVPLPSNCNDDDISATHFSPRPLSEPTRMTMHHFRARFYVALNRLRANDTGSSPDYDLAASVDAEISAIFDETPWSANTNSCQGQAEVRSQDFTIFCLQYHIVSNCINAQRMRMYRPFLTTLPSPSTSATPNNAWQRCLDSATAALSAYKALKQIYPDAMRRSHRVALAKYQLFFTGVTLGTFLLVEQESGGSRQQQEQQRSVLIREDVEMIIAEMAGDVDDEEFRGREEVPLVREGRSTLVRILAWYDLRERRRQGIVVGGEGGEGGEGGDAEFRDILSAVSLQLGGGGVGGAGDGRVSTALDLLSVDASSSSSAAGDYSALTRLIMGPDLRARPAPGDRVALVDAGAGMAPASSMIA